MTIIMVNVIFYILHDHNHGQCHLLHDHHHGQCHLLHGHHPLSMSSWATMKTKLLLLDSLLQEKQSGGRELEYRPSLHQIEVWKPCVVMCAFPLGQLSSSLLRSTWQWVIWSETWPTIVKWDKDHDHHHDLFLQKPVPRACWWRWARASTFPSWLRGKNFSTVR